MKHIELKYLSLFLFAMQAECEDCDDTGDFPSTVIGKNTNTSRVKGGYKGFALKKCSFNFVDINDSSEWETAISTGDVVVLVSCDWIIGSKASDATVNTEGSCEVDDIADRAISYTFVHSGDNIDFEVDQFFVDWQKKNGKGYDLMPVKCDDCTVRDFYQGTANVNLNTDDTKSGKESWTIAYTSHQIAENVKIKLPFGISTLQGI